MLEDLGGVAKKIKRAVTDTGDEVRYDPVAKPGVSNLLSILGAATGRTPQACADDYQQYGPLKADTADAVVALLEPIQAALPRSWPPTRAARRRSWPPARPRRRPSPRPPWPGPRRRSACSDRR